MECIEARALKSSFLQEISMKSTQQTLFDDFWSVGGIDNAVNVSSDEFSVDDLLDLSDKDFSNTGFEEYSEEDETENNSMTSSDFSSTSDLASLPASEIHLPVDEMENLEWLSQIVDDSTTEFSLLLTPPSLKKTGKSVMNKQGPAGVPMLPRFTVLGLSYPIPRKCRSKGSNKGGQDWSRSRLTESSIDSSSSYESSGNPVQFIKPFSDFKKPTTKKYKKNSLVTHRRCSHCQVQKSPQWRTGPLGAKTLCNACGVRFKSGRLFPEYRPACSPTFSGDLHSNSHRKVLEMRKKKGTEVAG